MAEFIHPEVVTAEVHKVQSVIMQMDVSREPQASVQDIADDAVVNYNVAKDTLREMKCVETKRTGGPRLFRREEDPKTIRKTFDAVTEPAEQGYIPSKCAACPFSNSHQRTEQRNRNTAGCVILGTRRAHIPPPEDYLLG